MAESKPKSGSRARSSSSAKAPKTSAKAAEKSSKAPATASASKASSAKGASSAKKPPPDLPGRIDGLRGWLDQIERKQSRMTYFMVAGLLIALATAGVALYLGITNNQDSATTNDVNGIKDQISKLESGQASTQNQLKAINAQLGALNGRVTTAERSAQAAKQQAAASSAAGASTLPSLTPTTPVTPTTPTTPNTGGSGGKKSP
jgi:septal ring factor EnvC (AmiA/AmiB activator)